MPTQDRMPDRPLAVATDDAGRYRFGDRGAVRRHGSDQGKAGMAKNSGSAADRLSALVAEIEEEAYARGRADASGEILAALGAPGASMPRPRARRDDAPPASRSARKRRAVSGKRAPRGTVRTFIERVLRDRPGLSAREIVDRADGDAERLVKPGSIRAELQTGRKQGRYESEGGRWSLTASPLEGSDGAPDRLSSSEPDDATGALADASSSEASPSAEPRNAAGSRAGNTPGEDVASGEPKTDADRGRLGMNW